GITARWRRSYWAWTGRRSIASSRSTAPTPSSRLAGRARARAAEAGCSDGVAPVGDGYADPPAQRHDRDDPREGCPRAASDREAVPPEASVARLGKGGRVLSRSDDPSRVPRRPGTGALGRQGRTSAPHRLGGATRRGSGQEVFMASLRYGCAR